MTLNQLLTENSAKKNFEDYVVGRSIANGQGPQFSLVSSLESQVMFEAKKPGYGLKIVENEEIAENPKEVMPDCCRVHIDEFKAELNVKDLSFSEKKTPLIVPKSRVFDSILKAYDNGKKGFEYASDKVKDVSYSISEKISSLYEVIKDNFAPKIDYSKSSSSYT